MRTRSILLSFCGFFAPLTYAGLAVAAPTVSIGSPIAASPVPDKVGVSATVSPNGAPLVSVVAEAGGATANMTGNGSFVGTLDLTNVPIGPVTLTVTATDANGDVTTASRSVVHDQPPTIDIVTRNETVARNVVRVKATCADVDAYPCASITVSDGAKVLATGTASIDADVPLGAMQGKTVLTIEATDTAGAKSTKKTLDVWSLTSPNLVIDDRVAGTIVDADAKHILHYLPAADSKREYRLFDRVTRIDKVLTTVAPDPRSRFPTFALTSFGAVWPQGEIRNGIVSATTNDIARVNGDWAIGFVRVGGRAEAICRVNVVANQKTCVPRPSGYRFHIEEGFDSHDIDEAGNIAFSCFLETNYISDRTWRIDAGTAVATPVESELPRPFDPVISGPLVVYRHHGTALYWTNVQASWGGATREMLPVGSGRPTLVEINGARAYYRARNGRIAYVQRNGDVSDVFVRQANGAHEKLSPILNSTALEGLMPNGQAVFRVSYQNSRYVGEANGATPKTPLPLGPAIGTVIERSGGWYVMLGHTLLKVAPGGTDKPDVPDAPGTDAGAREGGAPDAGVPGAEPPNGNGPNVDAPNANLQAPAVPEEGGGACSVGHATAPRLFSIVTLGAIAALVARRRRR